MFQGIRLALVCVGLVAAGADAQPVMHKGFNVLGYDPVWKGQPPKFTAADFTKIKAAGFDTVRINLRPQPETLDAATTISDRWLSLVDGYVNAGLNAGLTVIIEYHGNEDQCSNHFAKCGPFLESFWRQMAEHYQTYPDRLVFELLNEPHTPLTDAQWNDAIPKLLAAIRPSNPTRTVIISPTMFSSLAKLPALNVPNDPNVMTTIHYYWPRDFALQFKLTPDKRGRMKFRGWGTASDRARLESDFDMVAAWAKSHNQKIVLGEFGVWDDVPLKERAKYSRAVARAAEKRGFPWVYWQYQVNFSATDQKTGAWIPEIKSALQGRAYGK
ncbi:glycoside hydrolase family 5 protein [Sphingobium sp. H39-3-25]|uniref:glycoside hydrolase family 5 protein n=1 Tax=Sphingobium arseniciresistens TaxID=3030834 RepID=UPI0023B88E9F|nr:glycoside hydrolase family 5 protein [Sphingobium arseniciresistens]